MKVAAVVIVRNSEGKVLLLNRNYPPLGYGLPGGGVEIDETVRQGALRELQEETGIQLDSNELIFVETHEYSARKIHVFKARYNVDYNVKLSEEHSDYIWSDLQGVDFAGSTLNFIQNV